MYKLQSSNRQNAGFCHMFMNVPKHKHALGAHQETAYLYTSQQEALLNSTEGIENDKLSASRREIKRACVVSEPTVSAQNLRNVD